MQYMIILPILLQLVSAFLVYRLENRVLGARLSTSFTLTNFLISLILLLTGSFGHFSLFGVLELFPDRLGLLLSTYILLVSSVIHKYAENYMRDEPGYRRFYALLDLMTATLILLVVAGNLLLLFFAWHLVGVLLFLLLNHNYREEKAVRFANLSFITQRLADVPLLIAIVLLYLEFRTLSIPELEKAVLSFEGYSFTLWVVPLLVVMSAMIKSAQVPFHLWLVYSMEGPTPVSALMHAGIVNAGAFLVNRTAFLFTHENPGLYLAFFVGSLTAILGSALMLIQNDVKKSLGYSTVGQMGYMVMEFGIGAFALAVYHMMAHGIFKATLFLYSGNVIHSARKDPNIPEDEVYKVVTRGIKFEKNVPWLLYALLSILVPLLLVVLIHLIVEEHFLEYETQLIIFFFAWATGAQAVISTFRTEREKPLLSALIAILSLLIFLLGYVVMGHTLSKFLYPNQEIIERIYESSFANTVVLIAEMILIGLIILAGWVFIYYANKEKFLTFNTFVYTHLSRELYFTDLYEFIKEFLLKVSDVLKKESVFAGISLFALFLLALELSTADFVKTLLLGLFIPLLPSVYLILKLKGNPYTYSVLLLIGSLLGVVFFGEISLSPLVPLITFAFFSLRSLSSRNLSEFIPDIFGASASVLWISSKFWLGIFVAFGILILVYLGEFLRKYYGSSEFGFITGLLEKAPKFSALTFITALFLYGAPLFITFYAYYYAGIELNLYTYALFLIGWVILSTAILVSLGKFLFYREREDLIYTDLDDRVFKPALGILVLLLVIGFFIA
ncbi:NADH-quinone oxidoreductase subunit 5 family protein [Aquifex aeolicus]|uniref:NADH dehydrogenase I chain L n=1 Tax=Aquifex aeolicus (strain VF5) TaxID=224324 RepID=O67027_AQUAE|nr:NADH-quinone oxidoreductase subunit L [Aquifex aeolicus]AAC06988.1 NADH dehydrogenase I chain L [Aquifex aeolicus VF5]